MFCFLFLTFFYFIVSSLPQPCVTHLLWCAWMRSVHSWLYEAEVEVSSTDKSNPRFPGFSQISLWPGELDDGAGIAQETRRWKLKLLNELPLAFGAPGLTCSGFGSLLVANNPCPLNRFMQCFSWDDFSQLLLFVRGAHRTLQWLEVKKWLQRSQELSFNYF